MGARMKIEGSYRIEVERDNLAVARTVSVPVKAEDGEIVLGVDRFALTANNLTYAVHGADFGYWRAYPASDDSHGVVPVWGFGTVLQSGHPDMRAGQRFWGFLPSANYARLRPTQVTASGFSDVSGARSEMAPVYTRFLPARVPARTDEEELACLFQPLFATGFLIDTALGQPMRAPMVVMTSASSKTAMAAAWALRQRGGIEVIGLTSSRNRRFVEETGYYHRALPYSEIDTLDADAPAVLVDFAGDRRLVGLVHARMRGLVASLIVGDTHWDSPPPSEPLPGPEPELFFAPSVWSAAAEAEGADVLEARMADARGRFLESTRAWLTIRRLEGAKGWIEAFDAIRKGEADPAIGTIIIP
jgi:NADPH:quinone reductase-like Zn-dependent oxidoreductase